MKPLNRGWMVFWSIAILWLESFIPAYGQFSIVTRVNYVSAKTADRLDFRITAPVGVEKEDLPKTHAVLVKIYGAIFNPEFSESLIQTVKKCTFRPNVAQISENTIFILFKGITAARIKVTQKPHLLRLQIQKIAPRAAYRNNLRRGINLVKKKQFRKALVYLRRALRHHPGDETAYFWAGKARFALGDWEAAQFNLEKVRQKVPLKSEAEQLLAFIRLKRAERQRGSAQSILQAKTDTLQVSAAVKKSEPKVVLKSNRLKQVKPKSFGQKGKEFAKMKELSTEESQKSQVSLIQILLFLTIVITIAALPFVYYVNRRPRKQKKWPGVSFEKNLEAFRVSQKQAIRSVQDVQKSEWPEPERPFQPRREDPEKKPEPDPEWPEEPLFRNAYTPADVVKKVKKYASRGYTYDEIAQKLGIGKGELQLAMNLAGEQVAWAKEPGLRLMLDDD